MLALRAKALNLSYGRKLVLHNLNLSVKEGEVTAIVGPSGCGKSSFLSACNRMTDFIPSATVEGCIELYAENIFAPSYKTDELRKKVGMIFQQSTPFEMSILKNISLPLHEHGMRGKRKLTEASIQALQEVHLFDEVKDRLNESALSLSGGQQQRLCIARALALKPKILLMDEPCSALDPLSSGKIEDLILSLKEKVSIVIVTHNLSQARRIADHVALFWLQGGNGAGGMIEMSAVEDFFNAPTHPLTRSYINGLRG